MKTKSRPARVLRNTRHKAIQNATTRLGKWVHNSDRHGYPACGWFLRGIVYTDEAVNCPKCVNRKLMEGPEAS